MAFGDFLALKNSSMEVHPEVFISAFSRVSLKLDPIMVSKEQLLELDDNRDLTETLHMSGILLVELGDESEDSTCTSWNNKGEELLVKMLSLLDVHACCCAKEGLIKGSIVWVESFNWLALERVVWIGGSLRRDSRDGNVEQSTGSIKPPSPP